jgi:D-inositol-3-phosphate glycosyltransferase
MPCVVLKDVPPLIETEKDRNADQVSVTGSAVAQAEIVKALLLYGTYDRYYFLCNSLNLAEARSRLALYPNHQRAQFISSEEETGPSDVSEVVLFTGTSLLSELCHFRKMLAHPRWPVVGITHALSYLEGIPHAFLLLLEAFDSYDCMICTSNAGEKALQNIFRQLSSAIEDRLQLSLSFRGRLPVIPLGVDETVFCPRDQAEARRRLNIPLDSTVFLYLGRLSAAFKMDPFPLLLHFSQYVFPQRQNALLVLAGNDTYEGTPSKLQEMVAALGLSENVIIRANITTSDKAALYAAADVFLSLSDNVQETFGLTIIEAMASGLPVIASDWSGYRESIEHSQTGFLVPTQWGLGTDWISRSSTLRGNPATHWLLGQSVCPDFRALQKYIEILCDSRGLRRDMGKAARQRAVQHYSWAQIVRRYEELWRELLDRAARERPVQENGFRHGLASYDYQAIFKHYATGIIPEVTSLHVTPLGSSFFRRQVSLVPLEKDTLWASGGMSEQIAAICRETPEIALQDLVSIIQKQSSVSTDLIRTNITRLIKYGLLEPVHGTG